MVGLWCEPTTSLQLRGQGWFLPVDFWADSSWEEVCDLSHAACRFQQAAGFAEVKATFWKRWCQQVVTVPCMMPSAGGSRFQDVARYRLPQEAAGAVHGGVASDGVIIS
jgi:hypothetical protein